MGQIILYIAASLFFLGLLLAVITGFLLMRRSGTEGTFEYLLVLGSTVNGTKPSIMLADRIRAAYHFLCENPQIVCIATGGQDTDEDITEAACIANELIAMGIAPARIWLEEHAKNTRENLRFSLDLIEKKTGLRPGHIGILSNDFHIFRIRLVAKKQGISNTAVYAKSTFTRFFCTAFVREILALWYYWLFILWRM